MAEALIVKIKKSYLELFSINQPGKIILSNVVIGVQSLLALGIIIYHII
jgi:hypothetical protein